DTGLRRAGQLPQRVLLLGRGALQCLIEILHLFERTIVLSGFAAPVEPRLQLFVRDVAAVHALEPVRGGMPLLVHSSPPFKERLHSASARATCSRTIRSFRFIRRATSGAGTPSMTRITKTCRVFSGSEA